MIEIELSTPMSVRDEAVMIAEDAHELAKTRKTDAEEIEGLSFLTDEVNFQALIRQNLVEYIAEEIEKLNSDLKKKGY